MKRALEESSINVQVKQVGCVGICNQVPILEIHKEGETPAIYTKIKPEEVREVIKHHFKPRNLTSRTKAGIYNFFDTIVNNEIPKSLTYYNPEDKDTHGYQNFFFRRLSLATELRRGETEAR